jgi:hypothetical protein
MAMLERYIEARAAGAPLPMGSDASEVSPGNVLEQDVEQRLQEKLSATATSLAALMGEDAAPTRTPTADFLMRLDRALREVEELGSGNPYEVLGVEEKAGFDDVRQILEERLTDFTIDESLGRLPTLLNDRIDAAKAKLWGAAGTLCDPGGRAAMDIAHGRLRPETGERSVHEAFENELLRRRDQATEAQRAEFALADPYVEMAQEKQQLGDLSATRTLLQAALMYDPHNLGIRKLIVSVRDDLRAASPSPAASAVGPASAPSPEPKQPVRAPALEQSAQLDAAPDGLEFEETTGPSKGLVFGIGGGVVAGGIVAAVILMQSGGEPDDAEPDPAFVVADAGETEETSKTAGPDPEATGVPGRHAEETDGGHGEDGQAATSGEPDPAADDGREATGDATEETDPAEPAAPVEGPFAEVQGLLVAGEFEQGYVLAKQLRTGSDKNEGYRWMSVAACHQRNGVKARKAFHQIVGKNTRHIVRERCAELGIDITVTPNKETPREMYYRALEAEEGGDFKRACYLAAQSNFKEPSADTMVMSGACACRQGKVGRATKLHRLLRPADRLRLKAKCKDLGVEL